MKLDLNALLPSPLPTQAKYLKAISECKVDESKEVAYVGALGSGKSWVLCRAAIGLALSYPKMRILLGRQHSTDLRITTQNSFFGLIEQIEDKIRNMYPSDQREHVPPIGTFHKNHNEYTFNNGSVIIFKHLEHAEVHAKSLNVSAIGIDEASEVTEESANMLVGRRRELGFPLLFFVVSNPTGLTHWLYKWFVRQPAPTSILFRTNTAENQPNLPADYVQQLERRYPIEWIRRYLRGEWGGLDAGAPAFASFEPPIHVKQTLFYKGLPVWVGIDFGYQTPGVVWCHPDRKRRCQVVREWLPKQLDPYKLAAGILKRNEIWFPQAQFQYFCGHDGKQHASSAEKTPIEIMIEHDIHPTHRYHLVESGLTVLRNLIKIRDNGEPNLIVDPFCSTVIEGFMGEYRYEPDKEDKMQKTGIYDPLFDALRYVAYQSYTLSGDRPGEEPIAIFGSTKD